jgi:hypothetical protein
VAHGSGKGKGGTFRQPTKPHKPPHTGTGKAAHKGWEHANRYAGLQTAEPAADGDADMEADDGDTDKAQRREAVVRAESELAQVRQAIKLLDPGNAYSPLTNGHTVVLDGLRAIERDLESHLKQAREAYRELRPAEPAPFRQKGAGDGGG